MTPERAGYATHPRSRHAAAAAPVITLQGRHGADSTPAIAALVERLVDAIDIRESFEPDVAHWDTGRLIRDLERELARAWDAARPPADLGHLDPGLRP